MKHLRFTALSIAVLALTACTQTWDGIKQDVRSLNLPTAQSLSNAATPQSVRTEELTLAGQCPTAEAVEELASLSQFSNINAQNNFNLISKVDMTNLQNACSFDENAVTIDLAIDFVGTLGPQGSAPQSFSYPFFVAVTSADGKILAKEVFAAAMDYAPGQNTVQYTEKLRQIIPIENRDRGSRYKVLIGFQLTPDQLAYNRGEIFRKQAEALKPSAFEQTTQAAQEQAAQDFVQRPIKITP